MVKLVQGQSVTIGVLIADGYDMTRIESVNLLLNERKITPTIIDRMLRVELGSTDTSTFVGTVQVRLLLDDSSFGRREYIFDETLNFEKTGARNYDSSVDLGFTVVFNITISESVITAGSLLYNYVIGATGATGAALRYEDLTPEQIAELQQPAVAATDAATASSINANDAAQTANEAAQTANDAADAANAAAAIMGDLNAILDDINGEVI